jgi:alpha-tubulin suppressor-like RCC1 family protein
VWGRNLEGQLGVGNKNQRNMPVPLGNPGDYAEMQFSAANGAFLKYDGSLWITGSNNNGQLGQGVRGYISGSCDLGGNRADGNTGSCSPIQEMTTSDWINYSLFDQGVLAVKDDGSLWGWGALQMTLFQSKPTQIGTTEDFASCAAGPNAYYAIKNDGSLYSFGRNTVGQLGIAASGSVTYWGLSGMASVSSGSTDWSQVFAGNQTAYAIKTDGSLYAWGQNNYYQLGDGTTENRSEPVLIGSGTSWADLAVTNGGAVAMASDGTVYGWGYNVNGNLDNGLASGMFSVPTQIGSASYSSLGASSMATDVIMSGTLYTTGYGGWGENAISGTTTLTSLTPVSVPFSWGGLANGGGNSMGGFGVLPTATPSPTLNPQPTPVPSEYLIVKYNSNFTAFDLAPIEIGFSFRNDPITYDTCELQFVSAYPNVVNYKLSVLNSSNTTVYINFGNDYRELGPTTSRIYEFSLVFGETVTVWTKEAANLAPGVIEGVLQAV